MKTARRPRLTLVAALLFSLSGAFCSDIKDVLPLTDQILLIALEDGHVEYHQRGQPRSADKVFVDPLDTAAAANPASYSISSAGDTDYQTPQHPVSVGRKSKGIAFAWFVDSMKNGVTVNKRPDHVLGHWLYLELPFPMKPGETYTIGTGNLAKNGSEWKLEFDPTKTRSEAVHVNTLGYVPGAPEKFAYVYQWMGDKGSLNVPDLEGRPFHLVNTSSGEKVFTGKVHFRMKKENPETQHVSDSPPYGNFLNADVWECDFSTFDQPGSYVVSVDGVGCSWPFRIDGDVYREAFHAATRALYHNRSGIALTKPYTDFERPAPHNPKVTPGFAGRLFYTAVRWPEWGSESGDAKTLKAASKGALENTWGWYQDAGDWDSYHTHLRVAQELLFAYEMAPGKFGDGELNIPESGNGVPDLVDEAAWLPRFCYRLRHELLEKGWGTGGVSLRVTGDAFGSDEKVLPNGQRVGQGSWEDVDRDWAVAGEDPWATYTYAGAAAHLAYALSLTGAKDPVDWEKEAREAYAWAQKNTRPGDETKTPLNLPALKVPRSYAAAALFRLTGEPAYETQFLADTKDIRPGSVLLGDRRYGPYIYALGGGKGEANAEARERITSALLATADDVVIKVPAKRALRWGGNFSMPMLVGQQTTPWVIDGAVAYTLSKERDPEKARRYLAGLYTSCDYFLGTNALNQTWMTGVGPRHPNYVFHMDAWYNGKGTFHPGIIPYSPWRKERDPGKGPWDADWGANVVYPGIDEWPGNERWWNNRCSPMGGEFTVHQNIGPSAAIFGFLSGEAPPKDTLKK